MPSADKTPNIGLNKWQGNEYAKRQDFVDDNIIIDAELKRQDDARKTHEAEKATQSNLGHIKKQEDWITGTLKSGWTGTILYAKNDLGMVTLIISATSGTVADGTVIATLPSGYYPTGTTVIRGHNYITDEFKFAIGGNANLRILGSNLVTNTSYSINITYYTN